MKENKRSQRAAVIKNDISKMAIDKRGLEQSTPLNIKEEQEIDDRLLAHTSFGYPVTARNFFN